MFEISERKMNDNRRKVHENAVKRNWDFVHSTAFLAKDADSLEERLGMLRDSYRLFIEEHKTFVEQLKPEQFKVQEEILVHTEERFREAVTRFSMRISERRELEQLRKEKVGESVPQKVVKQVPPESPASPDAQQNIPVYLRERSPVRMSTSRERENGRDSVENQQPGLQSEVVRPRNDLRARLMVNRRRLEENRREINDRRPPLECHHCGRNHQMHRCESFRALNIQQRRRRVQQLRLCENCLMRILRDYHRCEAGACRRCGVNEYPISRSATKACDCVRDKFGKWRSNNQIGIHS